jgi:uncharacterized protein (TIGR03437 family)
LASACLSAPAQDVPTILQIEVENYVGYAADTVDVARVARSTSPLTPATPANFFTNVILGDIVRINGAGAKGAMVIRTQTLRLAPAAGATAAISDVTRAAYAQMSWELLRADGTPLGSLYAMSLSGGTPSPGSPVGADGGTAAIVGGTGAFLGAKGTVNFAELTNARGTSQAEDPSVRRVNGGGRGRFIFQVFPMVRPEISVVADGLEIFHADQSRVTADKPARAGEELVVKAKGLGPVRPAVTLGDPFPDAPASVPNSPIEVLVNDRSTPAIEPVGVPGSTDTYSLRFRVPDDVAPGMVSIRLTSAWLKGSVVRLPIN